MVRHNLMYQGPYMKIFIYHFLQYLSKNILLIISIKNVLKSIR